MAKKGFNEIKIGILVTVAVAALVIGLKFLSGSGLFETGTHLVGIYDNTSGLLPSSPVMLKGVQIGKVKNIDLQPDQSIRVEMYFNKNIKIPKGAVAQIATLSLISGEKMISMQYPKNNTAEYYADQDIIETKASEDLLGNISSEVSPMMNSVNNTVNNIDSISQSVNKLLNAQTQIHLQNSFRNIDIMMAELTRMVADLNKQTNQIGAIMKNVNGFTDNLNGQNSQINKILANTEAATNNLTGNEIKNTLASLEETAQKLDLVVTNLKDGDGTLGLLIRDRTLYDNLSSTTKTLDELLKDLKRQPGKYINLSVFPGRTRVVEVEKL